MPQAAVKQPELDFDADLAGFTPRQIEACTALGSGGAKFLLYGGALGGGKSYLLRWWLVRRLMELAAMGYPGAVVMLASEDYPSLKDRHLAKIPTEFPPAMGKLHGDHGQHGKCYILAPRFGGGVIAFRNLDDPSKYASAEFAAIAVDELTKNEYDVFTHLRTRLRWPGLPDHEAKFLAGTNPGSKGHAWVKQFWMDKTFPDEWKTPIDYTKDFAYVPSKADDNPHLDAAYWAMLQTLPESLRKAFRDGDWNIFAGQAFPELNQKVHGCDPFFIPHHWRRYTVLDWGYNKPYSVGWYALDEDGNLYRYKELYGWNGTANQGVQEDAREVGRQILEMERTDGKIWSRYADPSIWARHGITAGTNPKGSSGTSIASEFAAVGVHWGKADNERLNGKAQVHARLRTNDQGWPRVRVFNTCEQFWRTMPAVVLDKKRIEDVDTECEDHLYDEFRYGCMVFPVESKRPKPLKTMADEIIAMVESGRGVESPEDEWSNLLGKGFYEEF